MKSLRMTAAIVAVALGIAGCGGAGQSVNAAGGASDTKPAEEDNELTSFDSGDRVDVGDSEGRVVGAISNAADAERRDRIRLQVLEIVGNNQDIPSEDVSRLVDALEVLNPLDVTNEDGELVGYLVQTYVPANEYPELEAQAQATVDEFERQLN